MPGVVSNVMSRIFGQPAATPAAPNANANNPAANAELAQNQQQQNQSGNPNPGTNPPESPLEKFQDLFKVDPTQKQENTENKVDPNQMATSIMEAAGKVDFAKVIAPEDLQKIAAGGQDAVQAFAASLNKVSQTVYGQAAIAATKIAEQQLAAAEERFASKLPTLLNSQSSKNTLLKENKAFQNPAVAPLVEMIHGQLVQKFPNATDSEITAMAQEYFKSAASAFNPEFGKPSKEEQQKAKTGDDWEQYASM